MSGFVCDLHFCGQYGRIIETSRTPDWPVCVGCGLPLYELPIEHVLGREEMADVIAKVKQIADERGISYREMARRLHTDPNKLYPSFPHGRKLSEVLRWARVLDVPPDELLRYQPRMQVS